LDIASTGLAVTGTVTNASRYSTSNNLTNDALFSAQNTGGTSYIGIDNSIGSFTGTAYQNFWYGAGSTGISLSVGGTVRATVSSTALTLGTGVKLELPQIQSPIIFGDDGTGDAGRRSWGIGNSYGAIGDLVFKIAGAVDSDPMAGATVMGLTSTALTLGTGVNIVMASGKGINYGATGGAVTSKTLSDYEEGTWTPSLSFATPGDLSVAYSARTGQYQKVGNKVTVWFQITTSTFTHTTASSYLRISGLPFNVGSVTQMDAGVGWWTGVTKASYTDLGLRAESASATASFAMNGSGQAVSFVNTVDVPTGTTKQFEGQISYLI
jgi:hypothetical protein